jgi:hypothetical protein
MIETGPELMLLFEIYLERAWRIPVRFRLRFTLPGDIFTNIDKIGDLALQNLLLYNALIFISRSVEAKAGWAESTRCIDKI